MSVFVLVIWIKWVEYYCCLGYSVYLSVTHSRQLIQKRNLDVMFCKLGSLGCLTLSSRQTECAFDLENVSRARVIYIGLFRGERGTTKYQYSITLLSRITQKVATTYFHFGPNEL